MQKLRQVSSKSSQVDFLSRNGKSIVSFPAEASDFADVAEDLDLLCLICKGEIPIHDSSPKAHYVGQGIVLFFGAPFTSAC